MATGGAPSRQSIIRFGGFELDVSRQALSRRGVRLKLQNQPCQVLALLIQRAPETVSREEIRERVWGENVYIDVERNINFCIRQIRGVLLDNAAAPRYIETLPREGYRFIAQVEGKLANVPAPEATAPDDFSLPAEAEPFSAIVKPGKSGWRILLAALSGLFLIAALVFWLLRRDMPINVSGISPVTSYPGDEREPSLSPDGHQVAFSWNGEDGRSHIYVKLLAEEHRLRLTQDTAEDSFPAWSPDGKQIAFMRRRSESEFDIMLVPPIGGQERVLHRVQTGSYVGISGRMMAWSPDGKWLCFTSEPAPSSRHALFLLSLDSGNVRPLLAVSSGAGGDTSPAFSPDGRWLAFARINGFSTSKISFQRLTDKLEPAGEPLFVSNTSGFTTTPVWLPDSRHILFLDHGGSRISQAAIGGAAKPVYLANARLSGLTVDESGAHLITTSDLADHDIAFLPLRAGKPSGSPQILVYSTAWDEQPRFSPDGRWVAFKSNRRGASDLWLARANGENPRQLTHFDAFLTGYPKWSKDSSLLVFHARLPDVAQVYTIGLKDQAPRQITHGTPGFADASFSHDGGSVYMTRDIPNGPRLYRAGLVDLNLQPLWLGCCAMEAFGRSLLLYAKFDQSGIYARSVSGDPNKNPEIRLLEDFVPGLARFQPVEDGIYYVGCTHTGQPRAFRFYSFASAQSVDIAPVPPNYLADISVSPDRTRLAYTTTAKGGQDLLELGLAK